MAFILIGVMSYGQDKNIVGTWNGKLEVGGINLRLTFNISDISGALTATMDSPDQGAFDIPMDSVIFENDTVRIITAALVGEYLAVMSEDGNSFDGTWIQGGTSFDLDMERGEKVILNRPQEPKKPYPYHEEEVSYENKKAGITLAGTFTRPKEGEPFPAVLMITGSGAQDRDEFVIGHRPFLVLADYLTRQGIACLRVDDRGVGQSTGELTGTTTADFYDDARAGVDYLISRDDVDNKKIGLIGHSEGGIIAPWLASESDDIAFVVMLAGTGIKGDSLLCGQIRALSLAEGKSEQFISESIEMQNKIYSILRSESDSVKFVEKYLQTLEEWKGIISEEHRRDLEEMDSTYWVMQGATAFSAWFKYFIDYDPIPALKKVQCPVLSMIGSVDLQVPAEINNPAIEKALKESGNKNYKVVTLDGLNHLFQHSETGLVSEYGQIEETFAPEALEMIADWIKEVIL
jgi:pimeloyl-ACP methyl ester carboxylesterase